MRDRSCSFPCKFDWTEISIANEHELSTALFTGKTRGLREIQNHFQLAGHPHSLFTSIMDWLPIISELLFTYYHTIVLRSRRIYK